VTKAQIIDRIASATGLTKLETEAVVDGFMLTVVQAVEAGELVELRGFGTFRARLRKARTARNPKTDEPVEVPRHFVPVFKPAAEFRRAVNETRRAAEQSAPSPARD
jgi:nucleoid DNA-binding protein